jgi:fatty-acid peroxygenase
VRANRWARDVVGAAREGRLVPRSGSAVDAFVTGGGRDLPLDVAAAELVNVVRPTVAVAWFGAFAALALAEAPHYGSRLAEDPAFRVAFAHEVRRLSPFAPAVAARAMTAVSHRGVQVQTGGRVVLDIPGTNTHPASWEDAERFLPERFLDREIGPYCYVPQGGGPLATGHRCPGEDVATALLTVTLERLARTAYAAQRPHVRRDRIPTLPRGGLEVAVTRTDPVPSTSTQG